MVVQSTILEVSITKYYDSIVSTVIMDIITINFYVIFDGMADNKHIIYSF